MGGGLSFLVGLGLGGDMVGWEERKLRSLSWGRWAVLRFELGLELGEGVGGAAGVHGHSGPVDVETG